MVRERKNSNDLAKFSLVIMGVGFFLTFPFQSSSLGGLMQGGFEAGLVGGLADWFAVTALFRHPLGIRIPHTALLPKNRTRMIKALTSMLENDWLTRESIKAKIKQINVFNKLILITEKELTLGSLKKSMGSIMKWAVINVNIEKLAPFIEKELKENLYTLNVEKLFQSTIYLLLEEKLDVKALDYILAETDKWISKEETKLKIGIKAKQILDHTKTDGFLKLAISTFSNMISEEKLGTIIQPYLLKKIILLKKEDNPNRHLILSRIQKELESVKDRNELMIEINKWKDTLVNNWNPEDQIIVSLKDLQNKLILLTENDQFLDKTVIPFIKNSINNLKETPEKIVGIENWIQQQIFLLVDQNHFQIGILVKENLEKLDDSTLINMIEKNIGNDLQWIRVNGAICGFLIGVILTVIKTIL